MLSVPGDENQSFLRPSGVESHVVKTATYGDWVNISPAMRKATKFEPRRSKQSHSVSQDLHFSHMSEGQYSCDAAHIIETHPSQAH